MQRIEEVTIDHTEICKEEFAHVVLGNEHYYAHKITFADSRCRRNESMFDVITEEDFMSIMASIVSTKNDYICMEIIR